MKLHWPAPERNKRPIVEVLQRVLPARGTLLELSSGTGQHAVFFGAELPDWTFLPSDIAPENLASIQAWIEEAALPNLRPPVRIDVCSEVWDAPQVDAIFNANMIHIAPFECCTGLMRGAARHLAPEGLLVLYGPFRIDGEHTAPSNAEFDASLKARDARWGVRDVAQVAAEAEAVGLSLRQRVPMPANNQVLVFAREAEGLPSRMR